MVSPVSSRAPLQFDGLISGLRTQDIISKLVDLERGPARTLEARNKRIRARDQAYQDIKSRVVALQTAAQALKLDKSVTGKTATSASPTVATATADSTASSGTIQVSVLRLATATSVGSGGATAPSAIGSTASTTAALSSAGLANSVTAGQFSINGKSITIDPLVDSLTNVVNKITSAGAGVTASLVTDAYGRNNVLQVKATIAGAAVQLGAGADTSNFLASTGLVANGTDTVQSGLLGAMRPSATLSASNPSLVTSFAASGSFTINGKNISYSNTDSLNTVLSRINASDAGVAAAYDPRTDRVTLTSRTTGSATISLTDLTGNFLQGVGLVDTTNTAVSQTAGQTAAYQVNGGATRYSNANTITGALPGLSLTLVSAQPAGSAPVTVTVGADTGAATKSMQAFVGAYNDLADAIANVTRYNPQTRKAATLTGDSAMTRLGATARRLVTSPLAGSATYKSLADVGVTTGPYGSAVGSTSHLIVDTNKLSAALQNNPKAVQDLVSGVASSLTSYFDGVLGSQGLFAGAANSPRAETQANDRRIAACEETIRLRATTANWSSCSSMARSPSRAIS